MVSPVNLVIGASWHHIPGCDYSARICPYLTMIPWPTPFSTFTERLYQLIPVSATTITQVTMANVQPPSYEEIVRLIKKIQDNPPKEGGLAKAYQVMAEKAATPQTRALLRDEVRKLGDAANAITDGFTTVLGALMKVDKKDYKEADNVTPVPKLAGGWRTLSEVSFR